MIMFERQKEEGLSYLGYKKKSYGDRERER